VLDTVQEERRDPKNPSKSPARKRACHLSSTKGRYRALTRNTSIIDKDRDDSQVVFVDNEEHTAPAKLEPEPKETNETSDDTPLSTGIETYPLNFSIPLCSLCLRLEANVLIAASIVVVRQFSRIINQESHDFEE
jgi:hypothetical protein